MAISASDILLKLSVKTGSAGNSTASTPAASLGKYISTTQVSGTALNNLFDDVSGDENAALESEYRCIFIHNNHATLTWQNVVVWTSGAVSGGADAAIAVDNIAASAIGSASAQAAEIATEDVAPSGVGTFSAPTSKASGLSVGNIGPGQCRAIWVKRTTTNSAAINNDGTTIELAGDTAA